MQTVCVHVCDTVRVFSFFFFFFFFFCKLERVHTRTVKHHFACSKNRLLEDFSNKNRYFINMEYHQAQQHSA